jgi:hypothetical protein
MIGAVFLTSGWRHLWDPEGRSKDIEMSKGFTIFLGAAEFAGGLGVIFGVLTQLAAIGLIFVMGAPSQRKSAFGIPVSGEKPERTDGATLSRFPSV